MDRVQMAVMLALLLGWVAHAGDLDRALTEAEICEHALLEAHAAGVSKRMELVDRNVHHVDAVIDKLRFSGDLAEPGQEDRVRAQLQLGEIFGREGLLHEAIYQTFKAHFGGPREIEAALVDFKYLSNPREQGQIVAEVIERTLQFIPDVDMRNLKEFRSRASFLNLSTGRLAEFYEKWRHYDQRDEFSGMLQGAVLAILTTGRRQVIDDVVARETWGRRWFGRTAIAVPERPPAIDGEIDLKEIATSDRPYYATNVLEGYLEKSSRAARGYFVMSRVRYLTVEQLEFVRDRALDWDLKSSLIGTVHRELQWRANLRAKFGSLTELRRNERELKRALRPHDERSGYDNRRVHERIGELWHLGAETGVTLGVDLLKAVADSGTPAQFVNTVVSARDALISRLRGQLEPTRELILKTVALANEVGLDRDQHVKVESVLTQLVASLSKKGERTLSFEIGRLEERPRTYDRLDGKDLRRMVAEAATRRRTLEIELDQIWETN